MYTQHRYAATTIQLFRSAVSQLHQDPHTLSKDQLLNKFMSKLTACAPPIRLHRNRIDLQPTFNYLSHFDNNQTSLSTLQSKLAFLLGVTCFFRPSDLQRIPFNSVQLSPDLRTMSLEVYCPKEKRRGRHIIKSFQVSAHKTSTTLCPLQTLQVFIQRHPQSTSPFLFVNTISPNRPLKAGTIQGWLSRLLRKSTTEPRVNIRSITVVIWLLGIKYKNIK